MSQIPNRTRRIYQWAALVTASVLLVWLVGAYIVMPALWVRYAHNHPSLDDVPGITVTATDIPGDPINVALIGSQAELTRIMQAADWHLADSLSLRSDLEIAADSVLDRPYAKAPVSDLFLFGRKEDLAFEQPVGNNPRHRHHVRFWNTGKQGDDRRPVWVGSAVYDQRVGLSRTTGQITHVTAANLDAERDFLFQCIEGTKQLAEHYVIKGFHKTRDGTNGGGDPWHTDGNLTVGVIATSEQSR